MVGVNVGYWIAYRSTNCGHRLGLSHKQSFRKTISPSTKGSNRPYSVVHDGWRERQLSDHKLVVQLRPSVRAFLARIGRPGGLYPGSGRRVGVIATAMRTMNAATSCAEPMVSPKASQPTRNIIGSSTLPAIADFAAPIRGALTT